MTYLSVQELKDVLAINHSDDDLYLSNCIGEAAARVETILGYPLSEFVDGIPFDIKRAIKLVASDFYNNNDVNMIRGADPMSGLGRLDKVVNSLLINYRKMQADATE